MYYRIKVLDYYIMNIPEGFVKPQNGDEVIKYVGQHKLTVSWKKFSKDDINNTGELLQGSCFSDTKHGKSGEFIVLHDLVRTVDNNEQHLYNTHLISENSGIGSWSFYEQLDDVVYCISAEYDYDDQNAQKIASEIVHSIEKWRH